ncbi:MAG: amino acid synthesis family protein, partial [Marinovum sp.]|nr:amino acid synthesis family protein [Marinovum sp.]
MSADIRKIAVWVEETHQEIGKVISPATCKAVAVAVIANPFAGRYVEDLTPLMDIG